MGRWCYFDCGLQYKFWFGTQTSGFEFLKECPNVSIEEHQYYWADEELEYPEDLPVDERDKYASFHAWYYEQCNDHSLRDDEVDDCVPEEHREMFDRYATLDNAQYYFEIFINNEDEFLQWIEETYPLYSLPDFDKNRNEALIGHFYQEFKFITKEGVEIEMDYDAYESNVVKADFLLSCLIYQMKISFPETSVSGVYEC